VAELKANKRLCPDNMVDELKALRELANKIVMGVGKYMSHEDIVASFTLRAKRLVTQETLTPYIADAAVDEKVERLLFVEDNIIGSENKRALAAFVQPVLQSALFDNHFQNPKLPLLQRLQKLAQIQARVLRSGFIDVTKAEIADKLDALACQVEARGKLFDSVEARTPQPCREGADPAAAGHHWHPDRGQAGGSGTGAHPGASGQARLSRRLHGGAEEGWRGAGFRKGDGRPDRHPGQGRHHGRDGPEVDRGLGHSHSASNSGKPAEIAISAKLQMKSGMPPRCK